MRTKVNRVCWDWNQKEGRRLWLWHTLREHSAACDLRQRLLGRKEQCMGILKYCKQGAKSMKDMAKERRLLEQKMREKQRLERKRKKIERQKQKIARCVERAEKKEKRQSLRSAILGNKLKIQQRKNVGVDNSVLRKQVLTLENKVNNLNLSNFNGSLSSHKKQMNVVQDVSAKIDENDEIFTPKVIKRRRRSNNMAVNNNNNSIIKIK